MKKITCSDLGGPSDCEVEIKGNTPEEMGKNCQEHVMEEVENGEDAHQEAVENIQGLSTDVSYPHLRAHETKAKLV